MYYNINIKHFGNTQLYQMYLCHENKTKIQFQNQFTLCSVQ